jgi:hypothetical protein
MGTVTLRSPGLSTVRAVVATPTGRLSVASPARTGAAIGSRAMRPALSQQRADREERLQDSVRKYVAATLPLR